MIVPVLHPKLDVGVLIQCRDSEDVRGKLNNSFMIILGNPQG